MRKPAQFQPGHLKTGFPAPWSDARRRVGQGKATRSVKARKAMQAIEVNDPWAMRKAGRK